VNVCITRKMKQFVLATILVVGLASCTYAEEETKLKETDRSYGLTDTGKGVVAAILLGVGVIAFGGGALLNEQGGSRKQGYQLGTKYKNDVLNFPDTDQGRVVNAVNNLFFEDDEQLVDTRPYANIRHKRATPLRYNRDGTISLRCKFNPESCRNNRFRSRRTRRGGKRLLSLYLKPAGSWGSSIDNLRKSAGLRTPLKGRAQQSKGKRLISLSLKSPTAPKPKPRLPSNIYTRAFGRFANDVTRVQPRPNQRIARPRPRAVRPRRLRRPHRGRRAPARPRPRQSRRTGKGKEVFSLYLKPPALKPRFIPGGRFAPARSEDVPLICKFQPKKCGSKGKKLFSIHVKKFKQLFPYAFPLI